MVLDTAALSIAAFGFAQRGELRTHGVRVSAVCLYNVVCLYEVVCDTQCAMIHAADGTRRMALGVQSVCIGWSRVACAWVALQLARVVYQAAATT